MKNKIFFLVITLCFVLPLSSAYIWSDELSTGLYSYYKMNETSGTTVFDSLGVRNATASSASLANSQGIIGTGYNFSVGSNSNIVFPAYGDNRNWSISFWYKTGSGYSGTPRLARYINGGTNGYLWFEDGGGGLLARFYGSGGPGFQDISVPNFFNDAPGTWKHFVMTYNQDDSITLYINGVVNKTASTVVNMNDVSGGNWYFGEGTSSMKGNYDEAAVWNDSILTAQEVIELYNGGLGITYDPDPSFLIVALDSPATGTTTLNTSLNFSSTLTSFAGYNLTNATLFVWNNTGIINQTLITVTGTSNTTNTEFIETLPAGSIEWNVFACASDGSSTECLMQATNNTLFKGARIENEYFVTPVNEGSSNVFELNLTTDALTNVLSGRVFYNNTFYTASIVNDVQNNYTLRASIPSATVSSDTNISFNWEVTLVGGATLNTTTNGQYVLNFAGFAISQTCSSGLFPALTFRFDDEENLTALNSSVEYAFEYGFGTPDLSVNGSLTNINSFSVCINQTYNDIKTGDVQINYGVTPYVERSFYVFTNLTLSNTTTTNHTLSNLLVANAQSFLLTVQDSALTPYNGKYVSLLRWYPNLNDYRIVEMARTDDNGQGVVKVVVEDVDYRFGVYDKNGTLIKLTNPLRMVCLVDPCELTVNIDEITDFTEFLKIQSNLTYNNNTGIFTLTWNDPSQNTDLMNLTVYRLTSSGENIICTSTSTSFTGVITCDVSGYSGLLKAVVERSASPAQVLTSLIVDLTPSIISVGGSSIGLFVSFVIVLFVALAGVFNPVVAVIGGVIGIIPAVFLGSITVPILIAIITMGWVIIHFMKRA